MNFSNSLDRIIKGIIIVNVEVQGSLNLTRKEYAGIVQLVEHLLAKEKVASSSLAARSFFYKANYLLMATWPSGKARVCKTLIIGSNPIVASPKSLGREIFCYIRLFRKHTPEMREIIFSGAVLCVKGVSLCFIFLLIRS